MKRITKTLSIMLIAILMLSMFTPIAIANDERPFADIPVDHPQINAIRWAKENGIFGGISGNFVEHGALTRACYTLILWRLEGRPEPAPHIEQFPDVDPTGVHAKSLLWAREKGIMGGINGQALPTNELPRYQLVTLMYRYHRLSGKPIYIYEELLDRFPDAKDLPSQNDRDAMAWAVTNGIIGGINGRLELHRTTNREMGAVVLYRYSLKDFTNPPNRPPVQPPQSGDLMSVPDGGTSPNWKHEDGGRFCCGESSPGELLSTKLEAPLAMWFHDCAKKMWRQYPTEASAPTSGRGWVQKGYVWYYMVNDVWNEKQWVLDYGEAPDSSPNYFYTCSGCGASSRQSAKIDFRHNCETGRWIIN